MRKTACLLLASCLTACPPALFTKANAQALQVVANCGTVPTTPAVGSANGPITIDQNGRICANTGAVIAIIATPLAVAITATPVSVTIPLAIAGGWTPKLVAAIATTTLAVKTSAGWLGLAQCDNNNNAWTYLNIYNAAAGVAAAVASPTQVIPLAPNLPNGFVMDPVGMQYSTAISVAATTTPGGGTIPATNSINCSFGFN